MVSYCRTLAGNSMLEVKPTGPRDHVRNNIEHFCNFNFVLNLLLPVYYATFSNNEVLRLFNSGLTWISQWVNFGSEFYVFLQKKKSHNFIMLTCTTDWKSQIVFPRNGDAEVWIVGKYLSHARWRWQKGSLSYMFCCYSRTTFIRLNLIIANNSTPIFTARCSACAVLAMGLCLSVCLSQVGVLLKRLNVGSLKQNHTIAQGL